MLGSLFDALLNGNGQITISVSKGSKVMPMMGGDEDMEMESGCGCGGDSGEGLTDPKMKRYMHGSLFGDNDYGEEMQAQDGKEGILNIHDLLRKLTGGGGS